MKNRLIFFLINLIDKWEDYRTNKSEDWPEPDLGDKIQDWLAGKIN